MKRTVFVIRDTLSGLYVVGARGRHLDHFLVAALYHQRDSAEAAIRSMNRSLAESAIWREESEYRFGENYESNLEFVAPRQPLPVFEVVACSITPT